MNDSRKKQLQEEYKNRKPDMGILALKCVPTGELFLTISKDQKADQNGISFKLSSGGYPNRYLQQLWLQYGEDNFAFSMLKTLKYDNPSEDQTGRLNKLYEQCFTEYPKAAKIWK